MCLLFTIPLGSAHLRPEEMIKDDEPMEENPLYGIENFDDSEEEDIVENIYLKWRYRIRNVRNRNCRR